MSESGFFRADKIDKLELNYDEVFQVLRPEFISFFFHVQIW